MSRIIPDYSAGMALKIAHRGYVLSSGRIVLEGPAEDLARDERVKEARPSCRQHFLKHPP